MTHKKKLQEKMSAINFFELAKKEKHPRVRIRLLAMGHVKRGTFRNEIAEMYQITTESIRSWVSKFLQNGIKGLKEGQRSGRKKKLPTEREEEFRKEVERLQEQRPGGRVRASDIQIMLKEKFSVEFAHPSVYHLLRRCRLSWISARSKHLRMNEFDQEEFKKNLVKK